MRLKKNIALSENGFVFDSGSGNSFTVNGIGLKILEMMKNNYSSEQIKAELLNIYDSDSNTVEQDVFDFKSMLKHFQLIENEQ